MHFTKSEIMVDQEWNHKIKLANQGKPSTSVLDSSKCSQCKSEHMNPRLISELQTQPSAVQDCTIISLRSRMIVGNYNAGRVLMMEKTLR